MNDTKTTGPVIEYRYRGTSIWSPVEVHVNDRFFAKVYCDGILGTVGALVSLTDKVNLIAVMGGADELLNVWVRPDDLHKTVTLLSRASVPPF